MATDVAFNGPAVSAQPFTSPLPYALLHFFSVCPSPLPPSSASELLRQRSKGIVQVVASTSLNYRMATLPIEVVVFDILTRVPAKDAARSRVVCKEWCALLSTRDFERAHCSRALHPDRQKTLFVHNLHCIIHPIDFETGEYGPPTITPLPFVPNISNVMILAHLDGLLCRCFHNSNELLLWNPTSTLHKRLDTDDGRGTYEDFLDTVGLYSTSTNDYRVLHISRASNVLSAHVYSRNMGTWRKIPFPTNPQYTTRPFYWSPGTFCGDTLYFTVCECWVVGRNAVIGFNTITEQTIEINFPPMPSAGIFQGILVNVKNILHMVLTTGYQDMSLTIWVLQGQHWINLLPTPPMPPIPLSLWLTITHYMTNGNWFVMSSSRKIHEIQVENTTLQCLYPVSWFRGHVGAVFHDTLVTPSV